MNIIGQRKIIFVLKILKTSTNYHSFFNFWSKNANSCQQLQTRTNEKNKFFLKKQKKCWKIAAKTHTRFYLSNRSQSRTFCIWQYSHQNSANIESEKCCTVKFGDRIRAVCIISRSWNRVNKISQGKKNIYLHHDNTIFIYLYI